MVKVKIYTIGRCKEVWLADALAEYEKRLQGRIDIEWHIAKTDAQLVEWVRPESGLIALDPSGELMNSETFSAKFIQIGARISFVIGGSDGIPDSILSLAKKRWSLSPLTFTHQITRLILLEQLYRAVEIDRGSPYHK